jgi:hypothetical protein
MAQDCPRNSKALDDEYSEKSDSDSGPMKAGKRSHQRKGTVTVTFAEVNEPDGVVLAGKRGRKDEIKDTDILLDTQATVSVFKNTNLVSKIKKVPSSCRIHGIGGSVDVKRVADTHFCGEVWFEPRVMANVWSFSEAKNAYEIDYDKVNDQFIVHVSKKRTLKLTSKAGGLYIHDASYLIARNEVAQVQAAGQSHATLSEDVDDDAPPELCDEDDEPVEDKAVINAITVEENEQAYSPRQV